MAKTVDQLLAEFKVEGLDDKFVTALRSEITDAHTQLSQATTLKTQADQERAAAVAERQRIDQAIAGLGDQSLTSTQLKAQNKALRAVVESLKEDGITIDLPDEIMSEPKEKPGNTSGLPKEYADSLATMGQAIAAADITARYVGIYGKAPDEDMQTMVNNARRSGKTVQQYADERYSLSSEMKKRSDAAEQKRLDDYAASKVEEYKKAHPNTSESPFMRPGADTRFSQMPKIKREDPSTTRQVAGMSDIEKLRRAQEHGRQMLATALQEN